ncbi:MAG: altronate dehydratase [Proteobacteria bacterium]|nr:altronate dehydratase [Pseudomonadota bacterium]
MDDRPVQPPSVFRVDPRDDVAVALQPLQVGEVIDIGGERIVVRQSVERGHKLALRPIAEGAEVLKYGWPIGRTSAPIAPGDWVHSHNLKTGLEGVEAYAPPSLTALEQIRKTPDAPGFMGYRRANGRVGTRNEIWVLCTVGCVARTAQKVARLGAERHAGKVDGVHALTHPFGCSQLGDDLGHTRKLLAALAGHPNAGGVLIFGLGCESNQLDALLAEAPGLDRSRLRTVCAQTEEDEIEAGLTALDELVEIASNDRREPCAMSDLVIGLKCGGSDGLSGLTANPLVGMIADRVAGGGGTPVLTEIPEIFGAERQLMARAASPAVFEQAAGLVNDFKRYFLDHGEPVSENPSPGNIAGGITTLEEKSLGAVQKAGRSALTQVLRYGEQVSGPGLALLEAPGNDAVSSTALTAAGCTIILFTTGRGTPLGFPAPTLKIATNSDLALHKPRWIDFDAGVLAAGAEREATADALLDLVLSTASGRPTRSELNDEREIAIWKSGVTH